MKRCLLLALLAGAVLTGCKDDETYIGQDRFFDVQSIPATGDVMPAPAGMTSITYKVLAQGGPNQGVWTVGFYSDPGVFEIRTDMATNRFQVLCPNNMTPAALKVTVKVDYGDTWIYRDISVPSRAFYVDQGESVGGQYRYTVNAAGAAVYTGPVNNPDNDEVVVTFKSGADVFTPSLTFDGITGSLKFTATAFSGYVGMPYGLREAIFDVKVTGKPQLNTTVIVRQGASGGVNGIPAGAIGEYGVPGGYFFRMKYGSLDVAGIDLLDVDGRNWTAIFDSSPSQFVNVYTDWNTVPTSTINPCPTGWRAMTLADAKKLIGGTVNINSALTGGGDIATGQGQNWSGTGTARTWSILDDGGRDATFGIFETPKATDYYHLMLATPGCHASAAQFARVQIRNADAKPVISIAGRTTVAAHAVSGAGTNDTWYAVRCVRDTPNP